MTDRKKSGVAFWATVVVVVVVLYPLSYGPAWWLHSKLDAPNWSEKTICFVYAPLVWVEPHTPSWISEAFRRYGYWWIDLAIGE